MRLWQDRPGESPQLTIGDRHAARRAHRRGLLIVRALRASAPSASRVAPEHTAAQPVTVAAGPRPRHHRQMTQDQPGTPREQLAREAVEAYNELTAHAE